MKGLSAGRVQSVATRLVVERERERIEFRSRRVLGHRGDARPRAGRRSSRTRGFTATLAVVNGGVAQGRDFARNGELRQPATKAELPVLHLDGRPPPSSPAWRARAFAVRSVDTKPYTRHRPQPFMTSTLQQEASRKLRFSAQHTMRVAQRLYENGYITYMRTDSTSLSETAIAAAREQARSLYGAETVPRRRASTTARSRTRRRLTRRSARPGTASAIPTRYGATVERDEAALYDLVWKRTVASPDGGRPRRVRLGPGRRDHARRPRRRVQHGGHDDHLPRLLLAYEEGRDEAVAADEEERRLPPLPRRTRRSRRRASARAALDPAPARYTEASLIKAARRPGIGRPSTYASIIGTILDRGYVRKVGQALVPTFLAFAVTNLLERHFGGSWTTSSPRRWRTSSTGSRAARPSACRG